MGYLLLSVLCSVAIANLLTWFNRSRKMNIFYIFAGNYGVASAFSWLSNRVPIQNAGWLETGLGILTGIFFLINFLIYQKNILINGQSLAVGVMRVSLLIPTLLSLLIFAEQLLPIRYAGIFIIITCFAFLSFSGQIKNFWLVAALFFLTGITDSFLKIYNELARVDSSLFIALLFSAALISTLAVIFFRRLPFQFLALAAGFLLGIPNQLTTRFFMESLASVKAAVAYPLFASGVVLLAVLTDALIWHKKYNSKTLIAYTVLIVGIVFLNI